MAELIDPMDPLAGIDDPGPTATGVKPSALDRVLVAGGESAGRAVNKGPLGLGPESRAQLAQLGIFRLRGRDDFENPMATLRTINEVVIGGAVALADLTIRAIEAPIRFVAGTIGATAKEAGASDVSARKLEAELNLLFDISAIVAGQATPAKGRTPGQLAHGPRVTKVIKKASKSELEAAGHRAAVEHALRDSLNKMEVKEVPRGTVGRADDMTPRFTAPGGTGNKTAVPGITNPEISAQTAGGIRDAAEEFYAAVRAKDPDFRVRLDDKRLLNDQVAELIATDRLSIPEMKVILDKHGITIDDFAGIYDVSIADSARRLQQLSALKQKLGAMGMLDELSVAGEGVSAAHRAWNVYKRVNNMWRGMLVSQLSTAVRNGLTSAGRVGFDTMQMGMEAGLQKIFPVKKTMDFNDALAPVFNMLWRNKQSREMAAEILSVYPQQYDRLWIAYSSDVLSKSKASGIRHVDTVLDAGEHVVNTLNIFNRFQDRIIRGPVFSAELQRRLKLNGQHIEDIVGTGRIHEIPIRDIEGSVDKALRMTFADHPRSELGKAWVKALSETPILGQSVGAFARFMGSSLKFNTQFSPLGYLRLASPAEWKAMAAGDMSAIAQATVGTSFLLFAHQIRKSEYAGERWYEIQAGDETIDARSFAPFAQYLFVADLALRLDEDRIKSLRTTDLIRGLAGTTVRAGAGLYITDSIINGAVGVKSLDKGKQLVSEFAGNWVAGFLTPLQMIRDFTSEFDEYEGIVRDTDERPFLGPSMSRIPGISQRLPPVVVPTRTAPITRESTIVRQLTGLVFKSPKNPVEKELDRLGFERGEYAPNTGIPLADREVAAAMGPFVEQRIVPILEDKKQIMGGKWSDFSDKKRQYLLLTLMQTARAYGMAKLAKAQPKLAIKIDTARIPIRERLFLEEELMKRAPNSPLLKQLQELR